MSEHVIQNPVPTPEQMAEMLGVSRARVEVLRRIMGSSSKGFLSTGKRAMGLSAAEKASADRKACVPEIAKDTKRAKTKTRRICIPEHSL